MQPLPHHYHVTVTANPAGRAEVRSPGLMAIPSEPPREFGGSGTFWSPETLTVAAVADCFVLTFRAMASASRLDWTSVVCEGEGGLDRADGVTRFTSIRLRAKLVLPAGSDQDKAQRILEKAKKGCLVSNSLVCDSILETEITWDERPALAPGA